MSAAGVHFFCGSVPLDCRCPDATRRISRAGKANGRWSLGFRDGVVARVVRNSSVSTVEQMAYEKGQKDGSRWAGDDPLARAVTSLIAIRPLYKAVKFFAQKVMIRTAENSGVPWQKMVKELRESDVYAEKDLVENVNISYPDYYTRPFHSYEDGNLSWEAAFDVEPATKVVMKRAFALIDSPQVAEETFRSNWLKEIEGHHTKHSNDLQPSAILDVGCSIGISSRYLRDHFPAAQVTGLDLSPYYLAVAQYIEKKEATTSSPTRSSVQYLHANGEETGLPSESFDIVSFALMFHELPQLASKNILREARRLLKPGGTIAIIDISPQSKVIQDLPPALFVMMKATEPWLDEFFTLNLKEELEKSGFTNVTSNLSSPRHATVTATAI